MGMTHHAIPIQSHTIRFCELMSGQIANVLAQMMPFYG